MRSSIIILYTLYTVGAPMTGRMNAFVPAGDRGEKLPSDRAGSMTQRGGP